MALPCRAEGAVHSINSCHQLFSITSSAHSRNEPGGLGPSDYLKETIGPQHHGPVGLGLLVEELARCSLFNDVTQAQKLIDAAIWLHITATFQIVHRRGADRARN